MNAKKIMGAVLVALLAAALFVGAGAAAVHDQGAVFTYQAKVTGFTPGDYINGEYKINVASDGKLSGDLGVLGTYTQVKSEDTYTFKVIEPTAKYETVLGTITPVGGSKVDYLVSNGGKVYSGSGLKFTVGPSDAIAGYYVKEASDEYQKVGINDLNKTYTKAGEYSIQAIFNPGFFIDGASSGLILDKNAFTFTVVDESDATLTASVDTVYAGEFVTLTVEGTIGVKYTLKFDGISITTENQLTKIDPVDGNYVFTMPNTGKATFQVKVTGNDDDEGVAELVLEDEVKVTINVASAEITAKLGANSYFIGDNIEISGTSTSELSKLWFTITGTNFKETTLTAVEDKYGKTWEAELKTAGVNDNGKGLDVGSYTIKIYQEDPELNEKAEAIKTVVVKLNQPFISIIDAPEVVVQGTAAKFVVNAEATTKIAYYIFGTNFFLADVVDSHDKGIANQFTAELSKLQTSADNMSTGQYFMVIQHPMYNGDFNIAAYENAFYLNTTDDASNGNGSELFNVNLRQTANAAQALCDALDTQNIDDMYVKYSFFVIGEDESFTISEIPSQIAQGTTLTISGVDTANADATVIVEMISTAFAAVPKETVGSAAFIAVTTEVAEDGTWEVTLDTSDLAIDEYALTVKIAEDVKKNVNINVVEAADEPVTPPTDEPGQDEPGQDEPVAPETPGFGALAALAGLGAVAVLLLRRE